MRRLLTILLLFWAMPTSVWATCTGASPTWTSTPDQTSVQTCIDNASTGDTINITAGTATWTSSTVAAVVITKAITLQGAGCATDANGRATTPCSTVITDNTAVDSSKVAIYVNYGGTATLRITGLQITLGHSTGNYSSEIKVEGGASNVRIDHCVFNGGANKQAAAIGTAGLTWVLIDHNTFLSSEGNAWKPLQLLVSRTDSIAWANAVTYGTANAVFVEDNTFTNNTTNVNFPAGAYRVVDNGSGGRLVFRYNILNNTGDVGGHGWDTDPSAPLYSEIYHNTFNITVAGSYYTAIPFRGGTGVIYSNTFNASVGGWDTLINLYYYCGCLPDGPGTGCYCSDNPAVQYQSTYPGREQPGFWPDGAGGQVSEPIYEWGNTSTISPKITLYPGCANVQTLVVSGRDYKINTQRPGYTAYQYPHPLQGGTPPAAPTNVRIR